ncbi:MAG: HEAT repeat domain-containing protein [Kofleriaceae bacterium]
MTRQPAADRFLAAVARFKDWASTVREEHRHGSWECDYEAWPELYEAWKALIRDAPMPQWEPELLAVALYAIARDNDCQALAREVPRDALRFLTQAAIASAEADAKWQLAIELGRSSGEHEELLLALARDDDEYVRRRAVQSLARIGSASAVELALKEWERAAEDFPWSRMSALWVLHRVGAPSLEAYLARASESPEELLRTYADKVRRGDVEP